MKKVLHQKKFQEFKKYTITEDYLTVEIKTSDEYHKFNADYENIGFEEYLKTEKFGFYSIALLISFLINIFLGAAFMNKMKVFDKGDILAAMYFFILSTILVYSFINKVNTIKTLQGSTDIKFDYNKENQRQEVDQFIEDLKEAKRNYIRKKYMIFDELLSLEELEYQFKWLYRDKYISKAEYDFMIEELQAKRLF